VIVTPTELEENSRSIVRRVIQEGETIQVQDHGKTVAQITPTVGVSKKEFLRILAQIRWTQAESQELKQAMDRATDVFGYAGRD